MIFTRPIWCFLFGMLLFSCNKRVQADMHREQVPDYQEVKADSLLIEDYDNIQKYSPAFIYSENYTTIQRGTYMPKSISKQFVESAQNIIDGYRLKDTTLVKNFDGCCMYLANDKPIALFSNRNPKSKEDVAGIFKGGSLVMVDTVFYNSVYLDSDKAPMSFEKWYSLLDSDSIQFDDPPLTYDAWYAIRINGKKYYTDYKLHNYIEYSTYIPEKKQMLLICSQGTGYDTVYDSGYPDFYEIAVLEKSSTDNAWVQVYRSLKLDLNNGGAEEYGISGFFISDESWTGLDSQGNFVIKLGNLCEMIWTGKELSVNWYKNDD